jgi:hypothetical protein
LYPHIAPCEVSVGVLVAAVYELPVSESMKDVKSAHVAIYVVDVNIGFVTWVAVVIGWGNVSNGARRHKCSGKCAVSVW